MTPYIDEIIKKKSQIKFKTFKEFKLNLHYSVYIYLLYALIYEKSVKKYYIFQERKKSKGLFSRHAVKTHFKIKKERKKNLFRG